jgi:hypothetical protein
MDIDDLYELQDDAVVVRSGAEARAVVLLAWANAAFAIAIGVFLEGAWFFVVFGILFAFLAWRVPSLYLFADERGIKVKNLVSTREAAWDEIVNIRAIRSITGVSPWSFGFRATMIVVDVRQGGVLGSLASVRISRAGLEQLNERLINELWRARSEESDGLA